MDAQYHITEILFENDQVSLCRGIMSGAPCLIKRLKPLEDSRREVSQLAYEYRISKSFESDYCLDPVTVEMFDHTPAIVYSYHEADLLSCSMDKRIFSVSEVLSLGIEILKALTEIHGNFVTHRLLSPHSIFWNGNAKKVKIINFGSAVSFLQDSISYKAALLADDRDRAYIAPECLKEGSSYDFRADFFSLGILLYELFLGHPPDYHSAMSSLYDSKPTIPRAISDIVQKLCSFNIQDRYKSAQGALYDLEKCAELLQPTGSIAYFYPGQEDVPTFLMFPENVYGREAEDKFLSLIIKSICYGQAKCCLVSGYSGIGKTTLIMQALQSETLQYCHALKGKGEQTGERRPYGLFRRAFTEFVFKILQAGQTSVSYWRDHILKAVGELNGQVIVNVIPEFEFILGSQPALYTITSQEAQNRLEETFCRLFRALSNVEHPCLFFADDLHWADEESLRLLSVIVNQRMPYFGLIGTYRSNEISMDNPLNTWQDNSLIPIETIVLMPLHLHDVKCYMEELLNCTSDQIDVFSFMVYEKTKGNPFFMKQFLRSLYDQRLLYFDIKTQSWLWDQSAISKITVSENVADMLEEQLNYLSEPTKSLLMMAACLGTTFDIKTLSNICYRPFIQLSSEIWEACQKGLLIPLNDIDILDIDIHHVDTTKWYRFAHDKIQGVAYSLIPADEKPELHLKIGRNLKKFYVENQSDECLFSAVYNLNLATHLIPDDREKYELARLNFMAGEKSKEELGFKSAKDYFLTATGLLRATYWNTEFEFLMSVWLNYAETLAVCNDFKGAERAYRKLLNYAKEPLDKVRIYIKMVVLYTASTQYPLAIESGLDGLALLGLTVPKYCRKWLLIVEVLKFQIYHRRTDVHELIHRPIFKDKSSILLIDMMNALAVPIYFSNQILGQILLLRVLNYSLRRNCVTTASFLYLAVGIVINHILQKPWVGYQFANLAIDLNEKYHLVQQKCKTLELLGTFFMHWVKPAYEALEVLERAYSAGLETGDYYFADLAASNLMGISMICGIHLETILKMDHRADEVFVKQALSDVTHKVDLQKDLIEALMTSQEKTLAIFCNGYILNVINRTGNQTAMAYYYSLKQMIFYLFDHPDALEAVDHSQEYHIYSAGLYYYPEHRFFQTLILIRHYRKATWLKKVQFLKIIRRNIAQLQRWAKHSPINFRHKWLILQAELMRLQDKKTEAEGFYKQALSAFTGDYFAHNKAIASECYGQFCLENGKLEQASLHIKQSRCLYYLWGATAKVEEMDKRYPGFL